MSLETTVSVLLGVVVLAVGQLVIVVVELGRLRRDVARLLGRPACGLHAIVAPKRDQARRS